MQGNQKGYINLNTIQAELEAHIRQNPNNIAARFLYVLSENPERLLIPFMLSNHGILFSQEISYNGLEYRHCLMQAATRDFIKEFDKLGKLISRSELIHSGVKIATIATVLGTLGAIGKAVSDGNKAKDMRREIITLKGEKADNARHLPENKQRNQAELEAMDDKKLRDFIKMLMNESEEEHKLTPEETRKKYTELKEAIENTERRYQETSDSSNTHAKIGAGLLGGSVLALMLNGLMRSVNDFNRKEWNYYLHSLANGSGNPPLDSLVNWMESSVRSELDKMKIKPKEYGTPRQAR